MLYMFNSDSFYSKICNNSFIKIMFNEYKYVLCIKNVFWAFFSFKTGSRLFT